MNYFITSIFSQIPTLQPKVVITSMEDKQKIETNEIDPLLSKINLIEPNVPLFEHLEIAHKSVLVILDPASDNISSINNEEKNTNDSSMLLLEKIMLSMNIPKEKTLFLRTWNAILDQESLFLELAPSKIRIIFLIGSTATQHFLGKDKKISQVQGQVFDFNSSGNTFYFISLYHPDFISLNSSIKTITWNSIKNLIPWLKQYLP